MGHGHHHHHARIDAKERLGLAQRVTWLSAGVNLVMTLAQVLVGWLANSQSLIAHGLHSFSDLLSDFLVLYASRESSHPADAMHPYGHARVETAATLILGVSLVLIGGGVLWESALSLHRGDTLQAVEWAAFWVAVATVVCKEGLYHYLIRAASRLRSQLLTANALHTRADAASALVVVVGIGGALLGWSFLDLLAAALMGFMILRMGAQLGWEALQELIDTGLDAESVESIRNTVLSTPGVLGLHELRTRRMAHQALVDAHVQVDPRISVSEGHRIAEAVRAAVLAAHGEVLDVLVHVDPEEDGGAALPALPPRADLISLLQPALNELPSPQRIVLHYLGGQVEVELFFDQAFFSDPKSLEHAESLLAECLRAYPQFRSVSLNCLVAPM